MKKVIFSSLFILWFASSGWAQISSQSGNALTLNGTNQCVSVNSNAALETVNTTVEAWVKPQWISGAPSQLPCIVGMSKPAASRYDIYINKNYSGVTVWNGAANLSFTYAFAQNQLYHIALVFGATTSNLYVNGYLAATANATLNTAATTVPLYIGSSDGTKEYFNGSIDEVRIWNVARTSQQIRESMHLPLTGSETGLVSYYQFNESSGTTTTDQVSGFTGTLINTPTRSASVFPFGGGLVNTQTEVLGTLNFTGTNLSANYTVQNGASITTTEINSPAQAYSLPSGVAISNVFTNQYWIVNRYGSGSYTTSLTFKTAEDLTSSDAATPGTIQLYQRSITSDGAWTYVTSATTVDATNDMATFGGITTGLGEYVLVRGYVLSASLSSTSFCASVSASVSYNATGMTFNAGNVFTAQLSNASGSFASPTIIGTLTSTSSTGSIASTIDQYQPNGTGYRIRVLSSNPAVSVIQDNGTDLTINNPLENSAYFGLVNGLSGYYKLDGNTNDASSNLYNGTIAGGVTATSDRLGTSSSAMSFNGTNSGVDVGNSANLRMYGSVSISAWINISSFPSSKSIIVTKYYNSESYQFFLDNAGRINLLEGNTTVYQTTGTVPLNQWVHVVGTTTSGNWKLYMNGAQVGSSSTAQSFLDSGGSFQIGKDGSSNRFTGSMDEVRVYNRVLSAAEVQLLYNDGIASNTSPVCAGGNISLSALTVTGATYSWTGPNSFSSLSQNPAALTNATAAMGGTYTLTTTKNSCASTPQRTIVVVNPIPTAPGVTDNGRCSNGTVTLTATGSTNGNYRWYTVSSGGLPIGGETNSTYTTPSISATTAYWVSISSAGCEGARSQINAIINAPISTGLTVSGSNAVCSGSSATFTVVASEASATYQAYKGTVAVSSVVAGGGDIVLTVPSTNLTTGSNVIKVTATKLGCGSADLTSTITTTLNVSIAITTQPANDTKCTGQNSTFSVVASGTGLAYQWRKSTTDLVNGGNISGATSASLTISSIAASDAGNYNCAVSGACPSVTSADGILTVNTTPVITTQPTNTIKCAGQPANFTVTATGTSITYQWRKGATNLSNGGNISGATTASLAVSNVSAGDAGNYNCVIGSNVGCTAITSTDGSLTVNIAPAITGQPANATKCASQSISFSVTATGNSLTYQWRKGTTNLTDGGTISGATTSSLSISSLVTGDAGNYNCIVSGTCSPSVTSTDGILTVSTGVSITSHPTNDSKCVGLSSGFSVTATGSGLTYQWRKGTTNLSNGGNITGATTASLTISALAANDAGNYNCVVTAACGSPVTSNDGVLTVNVAPLITSQPASGTLCAGSSTSFAVTATGTALTYQWRKGTTNLNNGGNISGATSSSLNLNSLVAGDAGNYNCVVTGTCSPAVVSNDGVLTINTPPSITAQPANDTKCAGSSSSFTIIGTGTGLTYQWRKGTTNLVNGGTISGATTATLTLGNLSASDAGNYNCVLTGTCSPSVTSSNGTLTVNTSPLISSHPSDAIKCTGSSASFSVTASGLGLTYQWRKGTTNLTNGGSIAGTTTLTLTLSNLAVGDAGNYNCIVSGTCSPSVTSNDATLQINTPPNITTQPVNEIECVASTANFSVLATGTALTYQWKKGTTVLVNGGAISGATLSALSISNLTASDVGNYSCVVSGTCGSPAISNIATLTINTAAAITSQPVNDTKCEGTSTSFSVAGTGTALTYQWRKNNINLVNGGSISGATSATLSISNLTVGDAGNYSCSLVASCGANVTTNDAVLTVNPVVSITGQPTPINQCINSSANFTVTALGTTLTYQWRKGTTNLVNGGAVAGATSATLTLNNLINGDAGNYNCVVSGACGSSVISSNASLVISSVIAITVQPTGNIACAGSLVNFTVTATGPGLTYQWRRGVTNLSNNTMVSGVSTPALSINNVTGTDAGNYNCIVSGSCGTPVTSNDASLTVNDLTLITTQPASDTVVIGHKKIFTIIASGTTLTYQWKKNNVSLNDGGTISGATTSTLTISAAREEDDGFYTCLVQGACGPLISSEAELTALLITGIQNSDVTIRFYPNPVDNVISVDGIHFPYDRMDLVDMQGKIMRQVSGNSDKAQINATGLSSGIYLVRIVKGKEILFTAKIIKQ